MSGLQETIDVNALTARIARLIDGGRVGAARPLLAAARRIAPASPPLSLLAARLEMGEGRLNLAKTELDSAIAETPNDPALRKCRAELRQRMGDKTGAAADAAE